MARPARRGQGVSGSSAPGNQTGKLLRELNPESASPNDLPANNLEQGASPQTAFWERASGGDCLCLAAGGTTEFLLHSWPHLPPHVKETIFTLVDAALSRPQGA